jgi:hypothetical protein
MPPIHQNALTRYQQWAKTDPKRVRLDKRALDGAKADFEWDKQDILACFFKLTPPNCIKSESHAFVKHSRYYHYLAKMLHEGEDVFMHFYTMEDPAIDASEHFIVIDSCHRPEREA